MDNWKDLLKQVKLCHLFPYFSAYLTKLIHSIGPYFFPEILRVIELFRKFILLWKPKVRHLVRKKAIGSYPEEN
jgi:hypothetical protein